MTTRWEKPGFEVLRVAGECTAYSGAAMNRPSVEALPVEGRDRRESPARPAPSRDKSPTTA